MINLSEIKYCTLMFIVSIVGLQLCSLCNSFSNFGSLNPYIIDFMLKLRQYQLTQPHVLK